MTRTNPGADGAPPSSAWPPVVIPGGQGRVAGGPTASAQGPVPERSVDQGTTAGSVQRTGRGWSAAGPAGPAGDRTASSEAEDRTEAGRLVPGPEVRPDQGGDSSLVPTGHGPRACFGSGFGIVFVAVMISVWGVGIFRMASGLCWSRCCRSRGWGGRR